LIFRKIAKNGNNSDISEQITAVFIIWFMIFIPQSHDENIEAEYFVSEIAFCCDRNQNNFQFCDWFVTGNL
jgi:hypothetical protein